MGIQQAHNASAFFQSRLIDYAIPDYANLLAVLAANDIVLRGDKVFQQSFATSLDMMMVEHTARYETPLSLFKKPLPFNATRHKDLSNWYQSICSRKDVVDRAVLYVNVIDQIFSGELADRHYELGSHSAENISERMHGLQSGTLAYHYGLSTAHILAASLHDVARMTHYSDQHGHRYHAIEGHQILAPLQLPVYCLDHAFAKWLLRKACPIYVEMLLSPVSSASLQIQSSDPARHFADVIARLNNMPASEQALYLHKLMFMRLVLDDFAKIPMTMISAQDSVLATSQLMVLLEQRVFGQLQWLEMQADDRFEFFKADCERAFSYCLRVAKQCTNQAVFATIQDLIQCGQLSGT